jgi:hypothetical protein
VVHARTIQTVLKVSVVFVLLATQALVAKNVSGSDSHKTLLFTSLLQCLAVWTVAKNVSMVVNVSNVHSAIMFAHAHFLIAVFVVKINGHRVQVGELNLRHPHPQSSSQA